LHCRLEIPGPLAAPISEMAAVCEYPLSEAVIVAVELAASAPVVAAKVAVVAAAVIVTETGAVSAGELSESATTAPPAGAG